MPFAASTSGCDTRAVTTIGEAPPMIIIECPWCDTELALETLGESSVDCPDCRVSVELAPDPAPVALAA
jgi:hypothetical protein